MVEAAQVLSEFPGTHSIYLRAGGKPQSLGRPSRLCHFLAEGSLMTSPLSLFTMCILVAPASQGWRHTRTPLAEGWVYSRSCTEVCASSYLPI